MTGEEIGGEEDLCVLCAVCGLKAKQTEPDTAH